MAAEAVAATGRIGPNALTQLLPLLERLGGAEFRDGLLAEAGVVALPDTSGLIEEAPVARLYQALRARRPDAAAALCREAGERTADYIMELRIPGAARRALMALPASLAAPLLARAIARNAWTFAGSGAFEMVSTRPPVFLIRDNPVVRGEVSRTPLCHWHAAVFQRLFGALVHPGYRAHETECCAMGAGACRFELLRS